MVWRDFLGDEYIAGKIVWVIQEGKQGNERGVKEERRWRGDKRRTWDDHEMTANSESSAVLIKIPKI